MHGVERARSGLISGTARELSHAVAILASIAVAAPAQTYPLLDSTRVAMLSAEISGDAAYDHIRVMTNYHRPQGSDTLMVAAQYVERMAKAFGLGGVRIITLPSLRATWNPGISDLWIVGGQPERIASSIQNWVHLADRSRPADVTAELIDVGGGTAAELTGKDVTGKIVLTTGDLNRVMADAVQRRGIAEGALPRPRRTIRFWWTTENDPERQYFAAHPDTLPRIWVNVNQDMVGADQAIGVMRTQDVTRLPAARFHFLNDVMESVIDYMVASNTSNITQYRNGYGLYPKPHLAHNGSLHRYNAQAVWYFGDSDHQSFLDAGVPAITFTNSPDRFIHSNLDDLFGIDRTQLGRNALSVALIAYTMASADTSAAHGIAAEVVGRGQERLGRSVRIAMQLLASAPVRDRGAAYHAAVDQVRYGAARERRAIRSLGQIAPSVTLTVSTLLGDLDRREAQALREVDGAWARLGGGAAPRRAASATETELAAMRPAWAGGPKEWLAKYDDIAAEAREGGMQYYGTVTPEAVLGLLRNVQRLGLLK